LASIHPPHEACSQEAACIPHWKEAMVEELDALLENILAIYSHFQLQMAL
jgi:hypothetical protein